MFSIIYEITPSSPEAHLFDVSCTVKNPAPEGQVFRMPAWIPGSYMIRDFARNVVNMTAVSDGRELALTKLDKQTWQCAPCTGELRLEYRVYAWDLSVRSAHLDTTHGFFNGTSVFVAVDGQEQQPCRVIINPPPGNRYLHWRVATALQPDQAGLWQFGSYQAQDYDELIDHPVEMGDFALVSFEVGQVPHDLVVTGRQNGDLQRIAADLQRICEHHLALFGELPPMRRYLFLVMCVGDGYGGLEHRASCSLLCSRADLPARHETGVSEGYRRFLGLCSHEYFHTWNVKQIKPQQFMPYRLERESYTGLLWAFEGITSYYDDLALVRCGLISVQDYLELLGQTITRLLRTPGRRLQTVVESSFDAWTKFYKQDENAANAIVSYYVKGALIACALDLTIRSRTAGKKSLDDVMRALWHRYGRPQRGIPETGLETEIGEITGLDLSAFFQQALHGTEDLALQPLLQEFGVMLHLRPCSGAQDKGGKPAETDTRQDSVDFGARVSTTGERVKILSVISEGAAEQAGLAAGDEIVAIDGIRVTTAGFEAAVRRYPVGAEIEVTLFRRDELMRFSLTLQRAQPDTCYLEAVGPTDGWIRKVPAG